MGGLRTRVTRVRKSHQHRWWVLGPIESLWSWVLEDARLDLVHDVNELREQHRIGDEAFHLTECTEGEVATSPL